MNGHHTPNRDSDRWLRRLGILLVAVLLAWSGTADASHPERETEDPDPELAALIQSLDPNEDAYPSEPTVTQWQSPAVQLLRIADPDYDDGISAPAGARRRSPREISNLLLTQQGSVLAERPASDMIWQWGQFLDHDLDLTEPNEEHPESFPIPVPLGDPFFDPHGTGTQTIPFTRSVFDPTTGTGRYNPRQQINTITAFIDASNVYGSDPKRTAALRTNDGTGRLKTSEGNFLPFNTEGLPNAGGPDPSLFLAGDIRVNEQVALSAMHTLWVREHNHVAERMRKNHPELSGDQIFNLARRIVVSEMQVITYREFLPVLLGQGALREFISHNASQRPHIANVFSTAGYRLGHTMLSSTILRLNGEGHPIPEGHLRLRDAFFSPKKLIGEGGLDPILKGLASQVMQRIDVLLVDDVRNFLFGQPGAGGLDLASLNIQRGRDHGLPDYNTFRIAYGLTPAASFADITANRHIQERLAKAYGNVNDVDVWVGALAEDHLHGRLVGELLNAILVEQFERLRDADPNWYQHALSPDSRDLVEKQTLQRVIIRNTGLNPKNLQRNVFLVP